MPYIPKQDRERIQEGKPAESAGDLAYLLHCIIVDWIYRPDGQFSYSKAAHAIGVLETVKSEFTRTFLAPYEDTKASINGGVSHHEAQATIKALGK